MMKWHIKHKLRASCQIKYNILLIDIYKPDSEKSASAAKNHNSASFIFFIIISAATGMCNKIRRYVQTVF